MFQAQMTNTILNWERRLKADEEKRKYHRHEPYLGDLSAEEYPSRERKGFFARLFGGQKNCHSDYQYCAQETCRES